MSCQAQPCSLHHYRALTDGSCLCLPHRNSNTKLLVTVLCSVHMAKLMTDLRYKNTKWSQTPELSAPVCAGQGHLSSVACGRQSPRPLLTSFAEHGRSEGSASWLTPGLLALFWVLPVGRRPFDHCREVMRKNSLGLFPCEGVRSPLFFRSLVSRFLD